MNIHAEAGEVTIQSGLVSGGIKRGQIVIFGASTRGRSDTQRVGALLWDCAPDRPVYPRERDHRTARSIRA